MGNSNSGCLGISVIIRRRIFLFFFVLISTFNTKAIEAPASQPSKNGVTVTCNDEWGQGAGREAECRVDTGNAVWNLRYYREGTEKLTLKGFVKNLVVLFPPRGYNHLVQHWWGDLVGVGKPIDTKEWTILSLGSPGDTMPQESSPIFLTYEEILTAQKAVVDRLYPKRKRFLLGGASQGGSVSWLYSIRYPDDAWGSIHMASSLDPKSFANAIPDMITKLKEREKEWGPYALWDLKRKKEIWSIMAWDDVKEAPDSYYENPQNMKDFEHDPKNWKSAKQFKELVADNWAESYAKYSDPFWMEAQWKSWVQGLQDITDKRMANMAEKMLIIYNLKDLSTPSRAMKEFVANIRKQRRGVKLTEVVIDDAQGHNFSYAPKMAEDIKKAIREFLN
jgi:pimeloyl-ACP methyl ester carboxylesterase